MFCMWCVVVVVVVMVWGAACLRLAGNDPNTTVDVLPSDAELASWIQTLLGF